MCSTETLMKERQISCISKNKKGAGKKSEMEFTLMIAKLGIFTTVNIQLNAYIQAYEILNE